MEWEGEQVVRETH